MSWTGFCARHRRVGHRLSPFILRLSRELLERELQKNWTQMADKKFVGMFFVGLKKFEARRLDKNLFDGKDCENSKYSYAEIFKNFENRYALRGDDGG